MGNPVLVGTYVLGVENVRLFLDEGRCGANACFCPNDGGTSIMTINSKQGSWLDCVSGVMHEAMEFLMHRNGCGNSRTHSLHDYNSAYLFVMNHSEFTICSDFTARFMVDCMSDLLKAWKKSKSKSKSKSNKK